MTKKFWKDFQNRIAEIKNIYLFGKICNADGSFSHYIGKWPSPLLNENDRLIKATFDNNNVVLVIERHTKVFNWQTHRHIEHIAHEYKALHREEIATIKFYE